MDDLGSGKWKVAARVGGTVLLVRENWSSSLKVYDQWEFRGRDSIVEAMRAGDFAYSDKLLIDGDQPVGRSKPYAEGGLVSSASVQDQSANELSIKVSTNKEGILFIPEYFDKYWRAEVNGVSVPIYRAFGSFRAVSVTAGESLVRMYYTPDKFYYGRNISMITVSGLLLYSMMAWWRKRRVGPQSR